MNASLLCLKTGALTATRARSRAGRNPGPGWPRSGLPSDAVGSHAGGAGRAPRPPPRTSDFATPRQ
eukprot:7198291-Pyramimonas_sp.AAC.1